MEGEGDRRREMGGVQAPGVNGIGVDVELGDGGGLVVRQPQRRYGGVRVLLLFVQAGEAAGAATAASQALVIVTSACGRR